MNINNKIYENGFDLHQRLRALKKESIKLEENVQKEENIKEIIDLWSNEIEGLSALKKRLLWDGISLENLNKIEYQKVSSNSQIPWKFWFKKIRELGNKKNYDYCGEKFKEIPFWDLWKPVSQYAIERIKIKSTNLKNIKIENAAYEDLESSLLKNLSDISLRVVWLLFNDFRDIDKAIKNYKDHKEKKQPFSESNSEEYKKFISYILDNGYEILFFRYPVLAKFVSTEVRLWSISTIRLIKRIDNNWNTISSFFNIDNLNSITKFELNKGDKHRGNQTVTIIDFSSVKKRSYKLVYKPKDISLEETFQELIQELNT